MNFWHNIRLNDEIFRLREIRIMGGVKFIELKSKLFGFRIVDKD